MSRYYGIVYIYSLSHVITCALVCHMLNYFRLGHTQCVVLCNVAAVTIWDKHCSHVVKGLSWVVRSKQTELRPQGDVKKCHVEKLFFLCCHQNKRNNYIFYLSVDSNVLSQVSSSRFQIFVPALKPVICGRIINCIQYHMIQCERFGFRWHCYWCRV